MWILTTRSKDLTGLSSKDPVEPGRRRAIVGFHTLRRVKTLRIQNITTILRFQEVAQAAPEPVPMGLEALPEALRKGAVQAEADLTQDPALAEVQVQHVHQVEEHRVLRLQVLAAVLLQDLVVETDNLIKLIL